MWVDKGSAGWVVTPGQGVEDKPGDEDVTLVISVDDVRQTEHSHVVTETSPQRLVDTHTQVCSPLAQM